MRLPYTFLAQIAAASNPFAALGAVAARRTSTGASQSTASLFGIGVDIAHIPRFERVYQQYGMHFLRKCLHPKEIKQLQALDVNASNSTVAVDQKAPPSAAATFLASRWAAKEALIKAAGKRLLFPEMLIERDATVGAADPRARIVLSGAALQWSIDGRVESAPLLALSHDGEYAVAFVAVQRAP